MEAAEDQDSNASQNNDAAAVGPSTNDKTIPFLSPVGAMSRNYSVALDEDDLMNLSPIITPAIAYSRNPGTVTTSPSSSNRNDRYWGSDCEANYSNNEESDDLLNPLLGRNNYDPSDPHGTSRGHQQYPRSRQNRRLANHGPPKLNWLNYLNVITYALNVS